MLRDVYPKISCVMVTSGRVAHVKRSTACYLRQTYPNRELVVISQGDEQANASIGQFLVGLGRDDILFFPSLSSLSLGALRNVSCEIASGELVCQWDDDDLYHPTRLMAQYKAIHSDNQSVASAYVAFLKGFSDCGELYVCNWSGEGRALSQYLPGSVMFHKQCFFQARSRLYPETGEQCHVQEDLNVLGKLLARGKVIPVFDPLHYLYLYHGTNTYSLAHHQLTLLTNSGKTIMPLEKLLEMQSCLENVLQEMGCHQSLTVKSLDGIAFTWHPKDQNEIPN